MNWKIVAWFYSVLHYVEAEINKAGLTSKNHEHRKTLMRTVPAISGVAADYEALRNFSMMARYDVDVKISPKQGQDICDLAESICQKLGFPQP